MDKRKLIELSVIEKLMNLNSESKNDTCITWTTFPYTKKNLKIVEESITKLNWNKEEYSLSYDENLIFIKKDVS